MRPPESASASLLPLFIGHDKALNRSQSDSPSGGSDCPEQLVYSDERHVAIGIGAQRSDLNRLYVAGHSAGGHLTAITMPLAEVHRRDDRSADRDLGDMHRLDPRLSPG